MTTQPEAILENNLVKQLAALGYERVSIQDELVSRNFRHTKIELTPNQTVRIFDCINE